MYRISTAIFITLLVCFYSQAEIRGQQLYKIPFSSKGNTVDLTVANTSTIAVRNIKVLAADLPEWVKMDFTETKISELKQNEEIEVEFSFNVEKNAPVGQEAMLKFLAVGPAGEQWTKQIKIIVSAPDKYELYQNFPNPFNPSTTISYQLSEQSKVSLKIYNALGEEVAALAENIREAGYYETQWNASSFASGIYIYQLYAKGKDGHEFIQRKKMLLIK
ncbi:MAG: T9SS type A sorting domain-containing protein [Ignavibacteria bacterium]|jgi:hypothetical protein|nr:T9SS type A sorting domain-containing protein [Ignavibacteria bacterium]